MAPVATPDWQVLRLTVDDRAAIYAETFPGRVADAGQAAVEWFTHIVVDDITPV